MEERFKPVSGSCFCGAVRYEAEVNLRAAYYCHCQACQKLTGSPASVGIHQFEARPVDRFRPLIFAYPDNLGCSFPNSRRLSSCSRLLESVISGC